MRLQNGRCQLFGKWTKRSLEKNCRTWEKAELFKADVIAYKTPIPSDIKYIKGSRNKISEIKNKSEKVFEQANVYLQETKKH